MPFAGFTLPDIKDSDLNDEKERRKILEYLYQLTEQLRYVLTNIDSDNLSDDLSETINGAYEESAAVSRKLEDTNGNVSTLKQFANSITLDVRNDATSSTITLMANGIAIASQQIYMNGLVTFTSLSSPGTTVIDGRNIMTGTISADKIDVNNLSVKYLNGAMGTFTNLDAVNGLVHLGQDYISINGVEIGYVPGFAQLSIIPPGSGIGNVGVGNYYWDQVKANSHPTASSIRYKHNVRDITDEETGEIDKIRPITYELLNKTDGKRYPGFIAEELSEIAPMFVSYDDDGLPESIDYSRIVVMLVHEIQKLRRRVYALETKKED